MVLLGFQLPIELKRYFLTLVFFLGIFLTAFPITVEEMQLLFPGGRISSVADNTAVYTVYTDAGLRYGLCGYDPSYEPQYSHRTSLYADGKAEEVITNSKCFTILPPLYDKIQLPSEGIAAVCKDGKWAYVDFNNLDYLTDFVFDAAMPFKDGEAKVMCNKEIVILNRVDLPRYRSGNSEGPSLSLKRELLKQLQKEHQYDRCIEMGVAIIGILSPDEIKDYSQEDFLTLLAVQAHAATARNDAMANTVAYTFNPKVPANYKTAYKHYRMSPLRQNFSLLSDNAPLCKNLASRCLEYIKGNNPSLYQRLQPVLSNFEKGEYKKAVYRYEAIMKETEGYQKSLVEELLYSCLLHIAGDFEHYNMADYNLHALSNDLTDPLLSCAADALSLRYGSAESGLKVYLSGKSLSSESKFLGRALLASIYEETGHWDQALNTIEEALALPADFPNAAELRLDLMAQAVVIASKSNDRRLQSYLPEFLKEECSYDTDLFSRLDILRLSKEWGLSRSRIEKVIQSLIHSNEPSQLTAAFKLTNFEKNLLHDAQLDWYASASASADPTVRDLFSRYTELRSHYKGVDIYNLKADYDAELIEMMELERQIKNLLPSPASLHDKYFGDIITRITRNLPSDACAVDFFPYAENRLNMLGAWFIDGKDSTPRFIPVADSNDLARIDKKKEETIASAYKTNGSLIWGNLPVQKYQTVYFSPSSNIEDMGVEYFDYEDKPLAAVKNVHRVSSIDNIHPLDFKLPTDGEIALFGGLDYGTSFTSSSRGGVRSGFLKFSQKEVDEIENIVEGLAPVMKFSGKEGTPDKFRALADIHPDVIHLATHGYQSGSKPMQNFMEFDRFNYYFQNTDLEDEDWLLSSTGLFLSEDTAVADSLNNLLLSRDVALTRLKDTALVVLSACNTSEGEKTGGYDYVMGLNYALRKADVKNIITSLWDVFDESTYNFMVSFYGRLKDMTLDQAFYQTVREFMALYPDNPKIWSSFILIEN